MSLSLEERRAERRRQRQLKEEASGGITVNGEDDLERRRRERREARLRASEDTTDDYSSRRSRRRGTDEDITNAEDDYSSYRSRRRRNWDEDETSTVNETPSVPDTSEEEAAAERRRRQREEEEEEARIQQEKEEEEQRQQEELRRQREAEEAERRKREEEARREEEERQRRTIDDNQELDVHNKHTQISDFEQNIEDEEEHPDLQADDNQLFIDEDKLLNKEVKQEDKLDRVKQWNDQNNVPSGGFISQNKFRDTFRAERVEKVSGVKSYGDTRINQSSLQRIPSIKDSEINNNKIKDKLDKFEHLQVEEIKSNLKDKSSLPPSDMKDGLKGRLEKFEKEIKDQEKTAKQKKKTLPSSTKRESAELSTPSQKVSAKLQQFEGAMKSQSTTKSSTRNLQKTEPSSTVPKRNILDRWNPSQEPNKTSIKSPQSRQDVISKSLSGNTELIATRYLEKASKSIEEPTSPRSTQSEERSPFFKSKSFSADSQSEKRRISEIFESQSQVPNNTNQSRSHGMDRFKTKDYGMSHASNAIVHSRVSSYDDSFDRRSGASFDASSERSDRYSDRYSQNEQEEEERLEQERLEQERLEEESRMAEEQKKKRGKRKGLGGLTPEKKKLLKQIIMQKAAEDLKKEALAKAEEKEKYINSRVEPILTEGLGEAELRKLCKKLHQTLAQIHSDVYDWEFKVGKQEQEITELTNKVNDSKGKFVKPVLRKVNKQEQKYV